MCASINPQQRGLRAMVGVSVVVQGNEIKGVRNRCDTARQGDQRRVLVVGAQVLMTAQVSRLCQWSR